MIDALFTDSDYVAAKKMLDVTLLRQQAIASNLANIETPNYKRLDVSPSFEAQLRQAVAGQSSGEIASMQPELAVDTGAISGRSDGNTVQLETEMLKLNQNTVENALETQLVSGSLARLRLAITGKG
ncbi:MAG TPA: flagellar basal body rod protein FlgB [Verrucomicrobiae bacterium]|jgi:flagellar basal-body rod protein FlgB|nr:flagellar basal body rod protein FlgB [Verrucomicrobiae bacterium]